jgi:hypothetical protein
MGTDIWGNPDNLDVHGNSMDRNVHGNRPMDVHGNPWDGSQASASPWNAASAQAGTTGSPTWMDTGGRHAETASRGNAVPAAPGVSPRIRGFMVVAVACFSLGLLARYLAWERLPLLGDSGTIFIWGGAFLLASLFPRQVGGLLLLGGIGFVVGAAFTSSGGFDLGAVPAGNWLLGVLLFVAGGWIASKGT